MGGTLWGLGLHSGVFSYRPYGRLQVFLSEEKCDFTETKRITLSNLQFRYVGPSTAIRTDNGKRQNSEIIAGENTMRENVYFSFCRYRPALVVKIKKLLTDEAQNTRFYTARPDAKPRRTPRSRIKELWEKSQRHVLCAGHVPLNTQRRGTWPCGICV